MTVSSLRSDGPGANALVPVVILVIAFVLVLLLMWRGWRSQAARDSDIPVPASPDGAPASLGPFAGVYVCTIRSGTPLARVHAHSLGERSRARVSVTAIGDLVIEREGARSLSIPATDLVRATSASGMAGKFMGTDALALVTWRCGDHLLDTGIRFDTARSHSELVSHLSTRLEEAA